MKEQQFYLGTIEATEQLIHDLYIHLRSKVNKWSRLTSQTPQARMGYIGQHLVSVVTGKPGGKSGARGHDLVLSPTEYAEIKTCYRVDQLGSCNRCGNVISSLETICSDCESNDIIRKDDSKWLISIRNDDEFAKILSPKYYYFVLFEYEDIQNKKNKDIIASIWKVNPRNKGFAYCVIDYYLNIRANSASKAPFNMWPHSFKFFLTKPILVYKSKITSDDHIETMVFPSLGNCYMDELPKLSKFTRATTLTKTVLKNTIKKIDNSIVACKLSKSEMISVVEELRHDLNISNDAICDIFSSAVYLPLILRHIDSLPKTILELIPELQ